jgi:3-deoxy-D-manno-octulosonic-acid transferase
VAVRSEGEKIGPDTEVYIANTMGELGLFYSAAEVAFVGGSLLTHLAGHNPMEPARLDDAVLSGRHVGSFTETYDILAKDDAVIMVDDAVGLGEKVASLFANDEMRRGYMERARKAAEREASVLERTMDKLQPILDSIR